MLLVENLVKEFQNTTAVDNISFKVEPGDFYGSGIPPGRQIPFVFNYEWNEL